MFQAEEVTFLQKKGQTIESPIITVEDRLLIGKKAKRHENAGDAVSVAEWQELPFSSLTLKLFYTM